MRILGSFTNLTSDVASWLSPQAAQNLWYSPSKELVLKNCWTERLTVFLTGTLRMVITSSEQENVPQMLHDLSIWYDVVKKLSMEEQQDNTSARIYWRTSGASLAQLGTNVFPLAFEMEEARRATMNFGSTLSDLNLINFSMVTKYFRKLDVERSVGRIWDHMSSTHTKLWRIALI